MGNFKAWVETTRAGNFRVRHREPSGQKVTDMVIDRYERITIEGKVYSGKNLANRHCEKVIENFHRGKLGECDLTLSVDPLIDEYISTCEKAGLSWMTSVHYEDVLKKICTNHGIKTIADLRTKIPDYKDKSFKILKNSTIAGELVIVFVFSRWLIKKKYMKEWPFEEGLIPSVKSSGPKFYTRQEWEALDRTLAAMDAMARLACNLAYYAGLRKIELVGDDRGRLGVHWEDLTWLPQGEVELMVRKEVTKGGEKSRAILLDPTVVALLGSRKSGPIITIERDRLWYLFSEARRKAALNPKLTIHGLRHSFAKNYLQYGNMDLSGLKDVLGHSDIKTTQIYSAHEKSHLAQGIRNAFENRKIEKALADSEGQKDMVLSEVLERSSTNLNSNAL